MSWASVHTHIIVFPTRLLNSMTVENYYLLLELTLCDLRTYRWWSIASHRMFWRFLAVLCCSFHLLTPIRNKLLWSACIELFVWDRAEIHCALKQSTATCLLGVILFIFGGIFRKVETMVFPMHKSFVRFSWSIATSVVAASGSTSASVGGCHPSDRMQVRIWRKGLHSASRIHPPVQISGRALPSSRLLFPALEQCKVYFECANPSCKLIDGYLNFFRLPLAACR